MVAGPEVVVGPDVVAGRNVVAGPTIEACPATAVRRTGGVCPTTDARPTAVSDTTAAVADPIAEARLPPIQSAEARTAGDGPPLLT
ncbi:hypothetical protein ABIB25_001468 [Nakamurella sp. UYEF19]|uniref:hypothetical protein n=1 Tax=Nakamurella sp. UYEF19 TaxID=1756392 RepID=UPI00339B8A13